VRSNEARGISIEAGPDLTEAVAQLGIHKFVVSLRRLMEGLQNDGNKEPHVDGGHEQGVGKEEEDGKPLVPAPYRIVLIPYKIFVGWGIDAIVVNILISRECFHHKWPIFSCYDSH